MFAGAGARAGRRAGARAGRRRRRAYPGDPVAEGLVVRRRGNHLDKPRCARRRGHALRSAAKHDPRPPAPPLLEEEAVRVRRKTREYENSWVRIRTERMGCKGTGIRAD